MALGDLNPAYLPVGARVGPWLVLEQLGRGAHGTVYRAVSMDSGEPCPCAVKLSATPQDPRFQREVELLGLLHHPSVPRLLGHGTWVSPEGRPHPYLAMELVDGPSLYSWARLVPSTPRRVLRVLAALARALEAVHAVGGVHRDVKGTNVLVRSADEHVFLTDFGSSTHRGASRLTWREPPPGTSAYRSPEAWRFATETSPSRDDPYTAGPADDVFALGVTAYRLVTEQYPASCDPRDAASRCWYDTSDKATGARPPHALNPRCPDELSRLITRMLSLQPAARGSARELAEALEQAARELGPEADAQLHLWKLPPVRRRVAPLSWRPWLAAVGLCCALGSGVIWRWRTVSDSKSLEEWTKANQRMDDADTVAVGDSAMTSPVSTLDLPSIWMTLATDMPTTPFPGQLRPDSSGRCPRRSQVALRGGCWLKLDVPLKDCDDDSYVYKGACYSPVFPPPRPATSNPATRDGGP
ncbi:serine/threonine-protein kinase [Myxococcus sp. CA040A]|uniref:serine/threonine protein kinase n=1 Tax=Myxococcus sp. CA040A TaxID=2741738 RepID=UPI0020C5D8F6|nr:serine/threonine-protein kinase [Myxococcus sp. CA040A]